MQAARSSSARNTTTVLPIRLSAWPQAKVRSWPSLRLSSCRQPRTWATRCSSPPSRGSSASASTISRLANAPFWWPPMPSPTTHGPRSGRSRKASSLRTRTLPVSVRAALRQALATSLMPTPSQCRRQFEAAQQADIEGVRRTLAVQQIVGAQPTEVGLEHQHIATAVVVHLHQIEQAEQRPRAGVLLDADTPATQLLDHQAGASFVALGRPAECSLHDRPVTVFHLLLAEAEVRPAEAGIQRIRFQLEQDQRLGGILREEAAPNGLRPAHLRQEFLGQRQTTAIDTTQAILARTAGDERLQVTIEKAVGGALRLEKFAKVGERDVAFAVRIAWIALAQRATVGGVQLAAITLVEVVVGIAEDQHPAVFSEQPEPLSNRLRQASGAAAHLVDRIR